MLCLDDFEAAARDFLPRQVFTYIVEAAETRSTLADNRAAFRDWWFVPRILTNVVADDLDTVRIGQSVQVVFDDVDDDGSPVGEDPGEQIALPRFQVTE